MKIKNDYILREVLGEYIVVPTGESILDFNGIISINEVGYSIWNYLQVPITKEELISKMLDEYEVDENELKQDIDEFLQKLEELNVLE